MNKLVRVIFFLGLALFFLPYGAAPVFAGANIHVNTTTDETTPNDGHCSLREAITNANDNSNTNPPDFPECAAGVDATDTITVPTGHYTLDPKQGGVLSIFEGVSIIGAGKNSTLIDANNNSQVFEMPGGSDVLLENLTVENGNGVGSGAGGPGGGMYIECGTLSLTNVLVSNNHTSGDDGGGLHDDCADLNVTNSTFDGNHANGRGGAFEIDQQGPTVTVTNSTFTDNHAFAGLAPVRQDSRNHKRTAPADAVSGSGGAIFSFSDGLTISGSTFASNTAFANGGAIDGFGMSITNSTFWHNSALRGGGIFFNFTSVANQGLTNVTLFANSAGPSDKPQAKPPVTPTGGNIYSENANFGSELLNIKNTIVGSGAPNNCDHAPDAGFTSGGYNISSDTSNCDFTATGDRTNTDPGVDPNLNNNGGPTRTLALLNGSISIDDVALTNCPPPNSDQRGIHRPQGPRCDAGAYEKQVSAPAAAPTSAPAPTPAPPAEVPEADSLVLFVSGAAGLGSYLAYKWRTRRRTR